MTTTNPLRDPKRGEIWRIDLEPTRGDESAKTRPCVVLSGAAVGRLDLRIIVPLTDWKAPYARYVWMTRLEPDSDNGLTKVSAADAFQVRSVSLARFVQYLGFTTAERVDRIAATIGVCVRG